MQKAIPKWCKPDCKFRDKKAKVPPVCTYPGKVQIENGKCLSYRKEKVIKRK